MFRARPFFLHALGTGLVSVAKTGMGSSAALVTSLTGALLHFFGLVRLPGLGEDDSLYIPSRGVGHRPSHEESCVAQCPG